MPVFPCQQTYMGIHVTNTSRQRVIGPNAEAVTDFGYYGVSAIP
jgi:hypothetical protein